MHQGNAQMAAISIVPATPDDIPALVRLHTAAFKSDMFSNLMLLNRPDDTHQALMLKSIDHWLSDDHTQIVKAVGVDGQIVGWACWVQKETTIAEAPGEKTDNNTSSGTQAPPALTRQQPTTQDPARVLGGIMRDDMVKREQEHLGGGGGKRYMVLQALATHPSRQGQGVGTRLVQWGSDVADTAGLPCWAHASPAGHSLYTKAGFEELDRSDYNLAEWAPGGKGGNRGWGTYTFRYMLRPARKQ